MFEQTESQKIAEKALLAQGFRFTNWIDAQDGVDSHGCIVMVKRGQTRYSHIYREIDPSGNIN